MQSSEAGSTYDILWREAMLGLLDQMEAENPEDPALAPKTFGEWACAYVKYVEVFKKLERAYDQTVHPQKRLDMRGALEACMGRMLEVKHWLVKLNRGLDFPSLDDVLVDMKLTPDVMELPCPAYFREERAKELEDRNKFLAALADKYTVSGLAEPGPLPELAPLPEEEAIILIQANERGRQARERAQTMRTFKRQRQLEDRRARSGVVLTQEKAAIKIQAGVRGLLTRRHVHTTAQEELQFIGMKPKVAVAGELDPQALQQLTVLRRKDIQKQRLGEYEEAVVTLKSKVRVAEGQAMRETVQDKINAWFLENRDPETGEYPDFPDDTDAGSKVILNPPLPPPPPAPAADGKKGAKKAPEKPKGKGKGKGKHYHSLLIHARFTEVPHASHPGEAVEEKKEETVSSVFVSDLEAAVKLFVEKWQDHPEGANALAQKHEAELVRQELRPLVFEEVRLQVDEEMRVLLQNLKDMVEAERAAKSGKKGKAKKGKKGKKAKKGKEAKGKGKKKKDPTADRILESLYAELVSNGIIRPCPARPLQDYLGTVNLLGSVLQAQGLIPDPSCAQMRQVLTQYCIYPLASRYCHLKAPLIRSVLLYGAPNTGKTSLCQAVAHAAGANFFDLSPRNTDAKYPGKAVALMIHMVFKVAKVMAPSVIYIDEIEKVFVSDKKRSKEFGGTEAFNRIKKEMVKEMKGLGLEEQVLLIGCSAAPQMCVKKDEKAFMGFFDKHIYLPLPDYASRLAIWPGVIHRHGGEVDAKFDISTLAHISDGYSSGTIDQTDEPAAAGKGKKSGKVEGKAKGKKK
ncbi:MAG: IQ and AAA domain-containing 1-like [Trebouxia sp. A1-2]|nr:MAG: IQ and AAA domain-containing 1-like [Trebouxia sp. A1-2]